MAECSKQILLIKHIKNFKFDMLFLIYTIVNDKNRDGKKIEFAKNIITYCIKGLTNRKNDFIIMLFARE